MNFDIGEVITRGWQITWKHKVLWFYGALPLFFAVIYLPLLLVFVPLSIPGSDMARQLVDLVEQPAFGVVFFMTAMISTTLSLTAQLFGNAAMTLGAVRAEDGLEKQGFRELFRSSLPFVGRILGVVTLVFFVMVAIMLVFMIFFMVVGVITMGIGSVFLQLALYPIMLAVWAVMELAQAAVVADGMGVRDALARGWELFREHIWKFVLIGMVVYFITSAVTSIAAVPMIFPIWFAMFSSIFLDSPPDPRLMLASVLGVLAFFPVYAILSGASLAYMRSTFVVAYLRLTRHSEARPAVLVATAE